MLLINCILINTMPKRKEEIVLPIVHRNSDDEAEDIMLPIKRTAKPKAKPTKKPASPPKETSDSPAKKPRKKRAKKPCPQGHEPCDCPPKAKRKPTAYALFVKEHYNSVRDKPCCDRFKLLAQKWKEHKAKGSSK
jgi:hypothetical protein